MTGDGALAVSLPPDVLRPPAQIPAPPGLDTLSGRPGLFVGRTEELDRLDEALATPGGAVVQAVHGLGGIGKSTLAAHWAATRAHGCYPARWVTADTPAGVQQGLTDLAGALQPALTGTLPSEALAEWALQWLASHTGWLLILDNVNDPADIAPLLDRTHAHGRFLITSRLATAWHHIPTVVRLDVLAAADALDLLTRTATHTAPGRNMDGAEDLCAELGQLPLAIEQAAAYLAQNPLTTPRAYLTLLDQHPAAMYRTGAVGVTAPQRTIARIWHVTLDRIATLHPQAAGLLRLLAWYAPDQIPATLLDGGPADPPTLNTALGVLTAYSMITPDPATHTLSVHRLVQALARTPDPDDPHRTPALTAQAREQATDCLYTALPAHWTDPTTRPTGRTLLPHIDALAEHTTQDTDTHTTALLLNQTAHFLVGEGLPARAFSHLQRALSDMVRVLGDDDPDTLTTRNNLAHAYWSAGDLGRAIPLFEQTLTDTVRVLGEDHPDTLASRNSLACAYQSAGDLGRAIPLCEQTLTDMVRVLGEDAPDTLTTRNNLAHAYWSAGDLGRAIPLFEQTLEERLRVLGEDHPDTLTTRDSLAGAFRSAGDLGRAIPLCEQTLTDTVRVLGEDHPSTLTTRNNLAGAYKAAGDLGRAIPLFEQTLEERLRVLGEDHPETLATRSDLAAAYYSAGDLGRAIPLFEQTLTDTVRVLGEDHPSTLTTRNNLAHAYESAGDLGRAIPLFEQTLTDTVRVLGEDHPSTLTFRNSLADVYESAGDLGRAIPLYEQTLEERLRVLGEDHPDTLTTRNNLAYAYHAAGDLDRAIPLYEQTLEERLRVLGEDHPDTLITRNNLAGAYESAGDLGRAIPLFEQNLTDTVRVLDEDHPLTRSVRRAHADALAKRAGEGPKCM
ncbi:FxSxx-COOH system tetratricopeptide repeat protein [Streptomyces caniferus]|nr:FxSxx-COOH system tetratricopeptide repeat protein [Streptomyces caniferus]